MKSKIIKICLVIFSAMVVFLLLIRIIDRIKSNKCGDNICQKWEKRNNSCIRDCMPTLETGKQDDSCSFVKMEKIGDGIFPKWSPDGSLVAFTREVKSQTDPSGISFEIFVANPDGSNERCLTCDRKKLENVGFLGQPYWHINGGYIVFTAENTKYARKGSGVSTRPGIGRNHDVWIMTADGEKFWKMTDYSDNWGVIRPSFSHDGKTLYWNEEFLMEKYPNGKPGVDKHPGCWWGSENLRKRKGEELCAWRIKLADIFFEKGEPKISNERAIDPPEGYTIIEGTGFTPDDKNFTYSYCNIEDQKGKCLWGNIYISDVEGKNLKALTNDFRKHNENPEMSPDGKKILFNHGEGNPGEGEEIWIMDSDGDNKKRLTHFSLFGYPEYNPNAKQIPESTWSPDGRSVIFSHVNQKKESGLGIHVPGELYKIEFKGNCGNK